MTLVDEIKDRLDLRDLVGRAVQLHANGTGNLGLCPFHAEKSGSFRVWEDHFHCFGCGASGDVFDWLERHEGIDFREALRRLAQETGVTLRADPDAERQRQEHLNRTATLRKAVEHYHAALPADARAWLIGRGYKAEFLEEYLVGFAQGDVDLAALGDRSAARDAGLIAESGRAALYGRLTFPIWGRGEEIVGIAGRAWPDEGKGPKYVAIPSGEAPLLNARGLRHPAGRRADGTREVWLCEGDTDTAMAVQCGLAAVGVRGTGGLKDAFLPLFQRIDRINVAADSDESGRRLLQRAGEVFGMRAWVIAFPPDQDLSDFVRAGGDLQALAATAKPWPEWRIEQIPEAVEAGEIQRHLDAIVPAIARMPAVLRDHMGRRLGKRLGITLQPIREAIAAALKLQEEQVEATVEHQDRAGVIWEDRKVVNPHQFVHDGVTHLAIVVRARTLKDDRVIEELVPHVVTSRRAITPLDDLSIEGVSWPRTRVPLPLIADRWRRSTGDHSLRRFLGEDVQVDPLAVYREVRAHFQRWIDYPNPAYYDLLSLWTIGTYWYALFRSFPYLHLHAPFRSGKTLTLGVIQELAWNALSSASITPAAMYRTIEACSPTLLIDEAEKLHGGKASKDEQPDDRMEILKAGYKTGFPVIRCVGQNSEPTAFDCYSPKAFGSIGGIEAVLGDRMITLHLARKRAEAQVEEFLADQAIPILHATRDKLYCLALTEGTEIARMIAEGVDGIVQDVGASVGWTDLRDRDRELWTPILTIALWLDDHLARGGDLDPQDGLAARMLRLARASVEEKRGRESQEHVEVAILEGLVEFVATNHQTGPLADWWPSQHVVKWLRENVEGLGWLERSQRLYAELEKLRVIRDRGQDVRRQRLGEGGARVHCLRIDRGFLQEAAERFGARKAGDR